MTLGTAHGGLSPGTLAVTALGLVIPVHLAFNVLNQLRLLVPVLIAFGMAGLGAAGVVLALRADPMASSVFIWVFGLAIVSTWVAWPLSSGSRR